MFRFLKFVFTLGLLGAFIWFGLTVRLGERTLFEHAQAILKTHESQELVRGTKEKVGDIVERATGRVVRDVAKNAPSPGNTRGEGTSQDFEAAPSSPPMEELPAKDRKALRGLIERRRSSGNE